MILSRGEILESLKFGDIQIKPFKNSQIGAASVDLTLGKEFRFFKDHKKINLTENYDYKKITFKKRLKKLELEPGDFVLGETKEILKLPDNVFGLLGGRTRFARLGLLIHATASFIQPGCKNKQIFEIKNISNQTLVIKPGLRIAQLAFVRMEGHSVYKGKFRYQKSV
ncbi:MAG: dCTP deaminase [archaeon]